jgi:energy-coupling factor transport system permease protein
MKFLKDITLGQYFPVQSLLHQLDPRTKFICSLWFISWLLIFDDWFNMSFIAFILILAIYFSNIPFSIFLKNLRPFRWLFLLTFILHLFFSEGGTYQEVPYFHFMINTTGLKSGFIYCFRLVILISMAAVLTLTTSPIELTDGLNKLFAPLKKVGIPTFEIVLMMTLAIRFIPTLIQEAERIQKAQTSRGVNFEGNLLERIKNLLPLLLPLLISAFHRADELAMAMDSRCFHSQANRTNYKELKFQNGDFWIFSATFFLSILLFFVGFRWHPAI